METIKTPVLFTILNKDTKKCVSHITKDGKVYFVKNPFSSNYFIEQQYAQQWLTDHKLDTAVYMVIGFQNL